MMKFFQYSPCYLLLCVILIIILFLSGCSSPGINPFIPIPNSPIGPSSGSISIENGAEDTLDRTPALTISSIGAAYMSFSGDGVAWGEWVEYNTTYEDFNMVDNQNGTQFTPGLKTIYVRFKDSEDNLSSPYELAYDTIQYEFKPLNMIQIIPSEVTISTGSNYTFEAKGYDIDSNEVPLNGSDIIWEKCCGVGSLSDTTGLIVTYTAPSVSGERDITATCGPLKVKATIMVTR